MKMPAMPKPLKPLRLSKADMAVCGNGKNLGTVDVGYNCSSQFTPQCKKMVKRQANVPVKSKISKLKKAALLLKKSKKPTKLKKPKKKWSLKGRYAKYHPKIKLTYKQKAHKRKLMMAKLKKTNLKKWAKMAIAGRMQAKKDAANKKKLAAKAKRLTQKILAGKMAAVKKALHTVNVNFFSYWNVTGQGHEKHGHVYRGVSYSTSDIQRRYLSIVVNDDFEQVTIDAILKSSATGEIGDGKIFVSDIKNAYRIRTGEQGEDTLK